MRPHDIVVLLKIVAKGNKAWLNKDLAYELSISPSEVSESLHRSMIAGLIDPSKKKVFKKSLLEFLQHGLRYVYPVQPGSYTRGILTAHSTALLEKYFASEEKYVWPSANGQARGLAIEPLHSSVSIVVISDPVLYDMLALCDVFRVGRVREIKIAVEKLNELVLGNLYES